MRMFLAEISRFWLGVQLLVALITGWSQDDER